jgi:hypothetical protein
MTIRSAARRTLLVTAALLAFARGAGAEDRQLRGFVGATFGGGTNIVDPADPIPRGKANMILGGSAVFIGEMFGVEVDVGDVPGFFERDSSPLVLESRVTTITGNIVVAAPHRLTEYSLRPYLVGGGGLMRVRNLTSLNVFDVSTFLPTLDVGAGVVGFLTDRAGVSWEIRRFQSIGRGTGGLDNGLSFGEEQQLSFWRATMAIAIRY